MQTSLWLVRAHNYNSSCEIKSSYPIKFSRLLQVFPGSKASGIGM